VAIEAEIRCLFDQKLFVKRFMRLMAAHALAVFNGLMMHLGLSKKVFMAFKAKLPR